MKYEYRSQPVISRRQWWRRMVRSLSIAAGVVAAALGIGIIGYHFIGGLDWIDALLEASMILGGMGAVAPMQSVGVKLFASFYALFSGLVAISGFAILIVPVMHRLLHHFFHAEADKEK